MLAMLATELLEKRPGSKDVILNPDTVGSGAPFIPMKAAQWCLEANKAQLLRCENKQFFHVVQPIEHEHWRLPLANLQFRARLTWICLALLLFPSFTEPLLAPVMKVKQTIFLGLWHSEKGDQSFAHTVSLWKKVFLGCSASRDDVITCLLNCYSLQGEDHLSISGNLANTVASKLIS